MIKHSLLFGLLLWLPISASADTPGTAVSRSQPTTNAKMSANVATKPINPAWKAPFVVKSIIYLGDSYLDDGNYEAITGLPPEYYSNEPPWGTDVNVALGLPAVGRWTPAGSTGAQLGTNYAVAGASIEGSLTPVDTSFRGQVNLLLSDYPDGVPADTLVVVAIGTNDVIGAMSLGGVWSFNLAGWQLSGSGFSVPAVGSTVTVRVTNTFGLFAGPNNVVAFPSNSALTLLSVTAVDPGNSSVTLTNETGAPGTLMKPNAPFQMAATYYLDNELPVFAQQIKALLGDGANLVLALPQRTDFLPIYDQQSDQTLAYFTWLYLYLNMADANPKKASGILFYDLSDFFSRVFFNYTQYGFLYNYPGWDNNPNISANEYVFWDSLHPSGEMHQLIANDFIQFLQQFGLQEHGK
jgi:lysophospholipase L1-like esterase